MSSPTLTTTARSSRIDVASIRREQIVEAAVGIIVRQGLPNLSLSKIEQAAGMKRGQLTYYFPTKEDILLAVFDRLLFLMYHRMEAVDGTREERLQNHSAWECVQRLLKMILHPAHPDDLDGEFHALQYTFLAQIAHREDFRQRLASLYEEWRSGMAGHWHETAVPELPLVRAATPRILASFVQALVHGLLVQLSADPEAFDREEMLAFCIGVLAPLFVSPTSSPRPRRNGHPCRAQEDSRD